MRRTRAILVVAVATAACGQKADPPIAAPPGPNPKAAVEKLRASVVPSANQAVPEEMRPRLEFTVALAAGDRVAVLVPEGWTRTERGWKPADEDDLGFMTELFVEGVCEGACGARQDWGTIVDVSLFKPMRENRDLRVEKDEKLGDDGRLLWTRSVDRVVIDVARWKAGAPRYFRCRAMLDLEAASAAPAFEHACRTIEVLNWEGE